MTLTLPINHLPEISNPPFALINSRADRLLIDKSLATSFASRMSP